LRLRKPTNARCDAFAGFSGQRVRILGHNNRSEVQGAASSDSVHDCTRFQIEHTLIAEREGRPSGIRIDQVMMPG
jgi:hypothetical protein